MSKYLDEFLIPFGKGDKQGCVEFVLDKLSKGEVSVLSLYEDILKPALNDQVCDLKEKKLCVWKEHIRSAIVRTIIENCYSYVLREKANIGKAQKGMVAVICPDGEYHELGALMVSDYFTLCGYQSIFIGSSTPKEDFLDVIDEIKPDFIAVSVTNYYNLVSAKKTIGSIRAKSKHKVKIVVGGNAFLNNPEVYREIGADALVNTYDEVCKLMGRE